MMKVLKWHINEYRINIICLHTHYYYCGVNSKELIKKHGSIFPSSCSNRSIVFLPSTHLIIIETPRITFEKKKT